MAMEGFKRFAKVVSDNVTVAQIGLVGAIIAAVIAAFVSYLSSLHQFDSKMVEIGVSILSADPTGTDATATRSWATDLIEKHSGLAFSPEAKKELLHQPLGGAQKVEK